MSPWVDDLQAGGDGARQSSSVEARLDEHDLDWIVPDWPAPPNVRALMTTRNADHDAGIRRSMNLGRATSAAVR